MEKVKKFVVFPISLLLLELIMQFNPGTLMAWKAVCKNFSLNFGAVLPHILLGILAIIIFILGAAVLFTWVFTDNSIKSLLNRSTIQKAGIAFAVYYIAAIIVIPLILDSIRLLLYPSTPLQIPWFLLIIDVFVVTVEKLSLIFLITWSLFQHKQFEFSIQKKPLIWAILLCLAINGLYIYSQFQIYIDVSFSLKTNTSMDSFLDTLKSMIIADQYNNIMNVVKSIIFAIQDIIILTFINACMKNRKKDEILNV